MGRNGAAEMARAEMARCGKSAKNFIMIFELLETTQGYLYWHHVKVMREHYDNNNQPQHYTDMVNLSCAISARAISSRAISAAPFRPRHFGVDP